ncbi:MAG: hypothetical protein JWL59_2372, partial [Chthoniobacteraceae bacterium]|nr:hypothetical protein [Chthoniobacteraceae bacterium]
MITPLLQSALEPAVGRHRLLHQLFWCIVFLIGALLTVLACRFLTEWRMPGSLVILLALIAIRLGLWHGNAWQPDYTEIARRIESKHPALHDILLTAVEQRPDPATGTLNFLQLRVLAEAAGLAQKEQWIDAVPRGKLAGHWALLAFAIAGLLTAGYGFRRPVQRAALFAPETVEGVEITPGDVSLERGHGLVILAKFNPALLPSEAALVIEGANQPAQRINLVKNFEDPVFGGGLPEVNADLTYRIEYAGQTTRDFTVNVFEYPRLDRADATLHFPDYTKLPDKTINDTHRASAVEGSRLDVSFQLNKPVKSAALVTKDGTAIPLHLDAGTASLRKFAIRTSQTYELKLVDAEGRTNKVPEQFRIEALANRRPELKFLAPKGDRRVSPLEEIAFKGEAWDDFGLIRYGIAFNVAGTGEKEIELGAATLPDERRALAHLLKLEELGSKPDELVSWFIWAEDIGPDGKSRRTSTDMFFGEVRPFEEIFRAGDGSEEAQNDEQKEGAAGGKQQAATKLAELQKQIIQATWNLKRSEDGNTTPEKLSEKYIKDELVVRDSQSEALTKAGALAKDGEDPKAAALIANVTKEMQAASEHLIKAEKSSAPLPDALSAEQAAYNALLKLAAHEFTVSKQKQSGKGQASQQSQDQQQQLDELEIKDEKQRYETKSEAEPQKNEEQRAELAILNRLKELAQRQQDINERLKEFQNSLEAAKTEPEKEEIKRQLKRLREEEQQMIADLDEAREKMEQSPQQAQLAEERKQLEETRSKAQQASESMKNNEATQALASGTRAAQDLQKMREEFRKKTSGQFNEGMREMRTEARQLAQNQEQIAEKLKPETGKPEQRTLGGDGERDKLASQFEKQQGDLSAITEKMKAMSEQAEAAEPLLAKELYDTLRKTAQSGTGDTLQIAQRLAQRGSTSQAQQFEQKAREEIQELKSGVERAAESVLGDEAEALRQARAELDALSKQLNQELAMGRGPEQPGGQQPGGQQPGGQQPGGQQPGGQQPGGQQPGGQQPGGQQPGGQQPGGQQPGGQQPGGPQPGGQQPGGQQPGGPHPGGQQPGGQHP